MQELKAIHLKKGEERRVRAGHSWIYSNEIDTALTPLNTFLPGEEVLVYAYNKALIGVAYINPHSLISARLFSQDDKIRLHVDFFKDRIKNALELRQKLFSDPFYRLVFSEGDQLPGLVIDRFGHDFVCQINTAGMENKKEAIGEALHSLFPNINSILLRNDSLVREHEGLSTYVAPLFGNPPEIVLLSENQIQFLAPLNKGQKTGWFYDQRFNRARLKDYVDNQKVLDVFSYLGGFGIHAAYFGAKSVDCIETSSFACDFIAKNAELNRVDKKVNIINDDAFDALKNLAHHGKQYDVIIVDPPAFVKKAKDKKEGVIAYQRINELALKILSPGGMLVSCSCSMHVNVSDLTEILMRASSRTQHPIQLLERGHQAPDHPIHLAIPETDYLKALFVRKL